MKARKELSLCHKLKLSNPYILIFGVHGVNLLYFKLGLFDLKDLIVLKKYMDLKIKVFMIFLLILYLLYSFQLNWRKLFIRLNLKRKNINIR